MIEVLIAIMICWLVILTTVLRVHQWEISVLEYSEEHRRNQINELTERLTIIQRGIGQ